MFLTVLSGVINFSRGDISIPFGLVIGYEKLRLHPSIRVHVQIRQLQQQNPDPSFPTPAYVVRVHSTGGSPLCALHVEVVSILISNRNRAVINIVPLLSFLNGIKFHPDSNDYRKDP